MIRTARLDLVPATPALVRADLTGAAALAQALGAAAPPDWPPELFDEPALRYTLDKLDEGPEQAGWWLYYVVRRAGRVLVGVAGYKGPPADGVVEVGYAVVPSHRRQGYAVESTGALVARAFEQVGVQRVIAETLPELGPSMGVLEKLGFRLEGEGSEPGVIRYTLERPAKPMAARRA